jgi:hypothetical protein
VVSLRTSGAAAARRRSAVAANRARTPAACRGGEAGVGADVARGALHGEPIEELERGVGVAGARLLAREEVEHLPVVRREPVREAQQPPHFGPVAALLRRAGARERVQQPAGGGPTTAPGRAARAAQAASSSAPTAAARRAARERRRAPERDRSATGRLGMHHLGGL